MASFGGFTKHEYIPIHATESTTTTRPLRRSISYFHWFLTATLFCISCFSIACLIQGQGSCRPLQIHFTERPELQNLSTSYDKTWEDLVGKKFGAVEFEINGESKFGGVSMLHQLHCLGMLRKELQRSKGIVENEFWEEGMKRNVQDELKELSHHHYLHCLDYIAQSILCCGDDTLEPPVPKPESILDTIVGNNVKHQCRDASAIYALQNKPVVVSG